MSHDYAVTDGHALLSLHRYLEDVRHMVIFDDLVEYGHHRVRLYLPDAAFLLLKQAESKGIVAPHVSSAQRIIMAYIITAYFCKM